MTEYVDLDAMRRKIMRRKLRGGSRCQASAFLGSVHTQCVEASRWVSPRSNELDVPGLDQRYMYHLCETHIDMRLDQLYEAQVGSH